MTRIQKLERKMFKKIAYSVVLGAMVAGLAACSAKPDYEDGAHLMGEKFSFFQPTLNATMLPGNAEFKVDLIRSTTSGSVTLPLTLEATQDCQLEGVTVSDAVFADGSNKASITISVENGAPPMVFGGKLSMAEDKVSVTGTATLNIRIAVEYDWVSLGECTFADTFVGMDADSPYTVEIQKADGFDRWRIIEPYSEYYNDSNSDIYGWGGGWDGNAANAPEYIEMWLQNDGYLNWYYYDSGATMNGTSIFATPANYIGDVDDKYYDMSGWGVTMDLNKWTDPKHAQLAPVYLNPANNYWWPYCQTTAGGTYYPVVFITLP